MSAAAFFDAARALKRELTGSQAGLTQDEVDALNIIIAAWEPERKPTGLRDAAKFFCAVRDNFGRLDQGQVDGFNRLLNACGAAGWPIAYTAYGLTTAWHETAHSMHPVEEGYYLGAKAKAFQQKLRYYPWFGRGDVQLTWERNYRLADEKLGLNGKLIADPSLALDPEISARVLVTGMTEGWFTGKKLADYLPAAGRANAAQFAEARRIINGTDKAQMIAGLAMKLQDALSVGEWG